MLAIDSDDTPAWYEVPDYRRLVDAAAKVDPRIHVLVLLGGSAGLGRGEMMALKWSDLDIKRRIIHVQRSIWRGRKVNEIRETVPKGNGLIASPTFRQRIIPIAGTTDQDPRVPATTGSIRNGHFRCTLRPESRRTSARHMPPTAAPTTRAESRHRAVGLARAVTETASTTSSTARRLDECIVSLR